MFVIICRMIRITITKKYILLVSQFAEQSMKK